MAAPRKDVGLYILAIFLPPVSVGIRRGGCSSEMWLCWLLIYIFWIPGIIYAWYIIAQGEVRTPEQDAEQGWQDFDPRQQCFAGEFKHIHEVPALPQRQYDVEAASVQPLPPPPPPPPLSSDVVHEEQFHFSNEQSSQQHQQLQKPMQTVPETDFAPSETAAIAQTGMQNLEAMDPEIAAQPVQAPEMAQYSEVSGKPADEFKPPYSLYI